MNGIHVLKFGGTSMGDEHTWRRVLDIISGYERPVVVVSATARTTRRLLAAADAAPDRYETALEISSEIRTRHEQLVSRFLDDCAERPTDEIRERCMDWIKRQTDCLNGHLEQIRDTKRVDAKRKDAVASIGERLSSLLLAECGRACGLKTRFIDARKLIRTDSDFGRANPDREKIGENTAQLKSRLVQGEIPITGGYYGEDEHGNVTTLGFEGSDYTASLIGAALGSDAIEIWTDVNGIYTCDPRMVEEAVPIPEISFREATEMAYFGAKVLHPSTLKPAAERMIPVYVRNIFEPDHPGTRIYNGSESEGTAAVRALTFLEDVVIITVTSASTLMGYRFLSDVFEILERHHITVDVVTTTEASVSIALVRPAGLDHICSDLAETGEVALTERQGVISLIGFSLTRVDAITSKVFSSVAGDTVSLISFSSDKRNLNLVLPEEELVDTVRSIHRSLFNPET